MDIKIIDIFWDRIYLNIIFKGSDIEKWEIFLSSKTQKIKLELKPLEKDKYSSVINITNIKNITMLKNEDYVFIAEKQEKIETAKRMLEEKIPIEIIIRVTQLSKEEIEKIKKENRKVKR